MLERLKYILRVTVCIIFIIFWRVTLLLSCLRASALPQHLRFLHLDFVINVPHSGLCFPSLKFLHVEMYNLPNDVTERLFSACPVLQELSIVGLLINADVVVNFNISFPTLKKLGIRFDVGDRLSSYNEHKILIRAPNLERVHIIGYALVSCMVHELHSLTEVFIHVSYVEGPSTQAKRVLELLEGVNEIKFMYLSAETMYALDWAYQDFFPIFPKLTYLEVEIRGTSWKLLLAILNSLPNLEVIVIHNHKVLSFVLNNNLPTFPNLICLELHIDSCFGWKLLTPFLKSSPSLRVLKLDFSKAHKLAPNALQDIVSENLVWFELESPPHHLSSHVEVIEITNLKREYYELEMVRYLLENSKVLEKFSVGFAEDAPGDNLQKEILMFPRGSETCNIEFF